MSSGTWLMRRVRSVADTMPIAGCCFLDAWICRYAFFTRYFLMLHLFNLLFWLGQDIGRGFGSNSDMKSAVSVLTSTTSTQQPHEVMLLPVEQDALIPADESSLLATVCQRAGVRVYCERINSIYGHDAFLKEDQIFNLRLSAFLADGIDGVHDAIAKSKQL
jgi:hypothetical protein